MTAPGATFSAPITLKVYSVIDQAGVPAWNNTLGAMTQTFSIPYQPTSTPAQCSGDASRWYDSKDKACYHGLATTIVFNLSGYHIAVPADSQVIVTVSFNTTHFGPASIGESAPCYITSTGCPYDSLNISTDTTDGSFAFVGNQIYANGIYVNYTLSANACNGNTVTGVLALDTSMDASLCWLGYHPEISIQANTNSTHHTKGNGP